MPTMHVRTIATLSAVLSQSAAFSPSAFAQIIHALFIYILVRVVGLEPTLY